MESIGGLFRKELILKSCAATKEKVLSEVGHILYEKGLVKESFKQAIIEREVNYPTGLDLSPVAVGLPNVALPHTDAKHCKSQVIVFVKLEQAISFNNMMQPEAALPVHYLFVLVNHQKEKQVNVLSELMGFLINEATMQQLDCLGSTEAIYDFLTSEKEVKDID